MAGRVDAGAILAIVTHIREILAAAPTESSGTENPCGPNTLVHCRVVAQPQAPSLITIRRRYSFEKSYHFR